MCTRHLIVLYYFLDLSAIKAQKTSFLVLCVCIILNMLAVHTVIGSWHPPQGYRTVHSWWHGRTNPSNTKIYLPQTQTPYLTVNYYRPMYRTTAQLTRIGLQAANSWYNVHWTMSYFRTSGMRTWHQGESPYIPLSRRHISYIWCILSAIW